ncbi:hypothetical protein CONPUDRAFT_108960 [Coniophora puteana RWD-64-598 SS2]|uniref:DUF4484 domain-containing protein n=1 Tax=Coniophora puteana (strain RWD-64-598) TaxID=741705 RepID=A0A5M3MFB4_CONPW|nr:uncharacterized protein CONPUDRAFT_108960 [Coniophora puteana RWD-64-598 SS2]EIW77717.1 hypothetical protein CONPUDRAFT_108960 [Coniophora puteana RWD-64-598 SS2]
MAAPEGKAIPRDVVAIFHTSFHPTKGNVLDWSLKTKDHLVLDGIEFSTLPSGLHLVEQDVVYFTHEGHPGVSVFRRRRTTEEGQRGFRLSALGILLAPSVRPRAWRHVAPLRHVINAIYSPLEIHGRLEPQESDWGPARAFFEERRVQHDDLGGAGDWNGWSQELDGPDSDWCPSNPTPHLPHLLRILGPSALTVYKHVLGRRRILIYTLPPVEAACILCQVAADICYESQLDPSLYSTSGEDDTSSRYRTKLEGKSKQGINVLGMVTLSDLNKMDAEGRTGKGWIACTTDAIFLDKPSYYDIVVDLTTSTPNLNSRPTLYLSKPVQSPGSSRGPTHRLSLVRFTWSDIKLWNELERILSLTGADACAEHCCRPPTDTNSSRAGKAYGSSWTDAMRLYEDACIVCAGLWMGAWRGNSRASYSTQGGSMANWGSVRLEGDDDLSLGSSAFVRAVGNGIEGRPQAGAGAGASAASVNTKGMRRASNMSAHSRAQSSSQARNQSSAQLNHRRQGSTGSMLSLGFGARVGSASTPALGGGSGNGNAKTAEFDIIDPEELQERQERQILTTLSLLQTFHANTCFQLSRLAALLPVPRDPRARAYAPPDVGKMTVALGAKDVASFELGPLSALDARYVEWLAEEYGGGVRVVVKRSWRDVFGAVFGFG